MQNPKDVLNDKNFWGLPAEERRKVMSTVDTNFAGLPSAEQDKIIKVAPPPGDEGFFSTLWKDVKGAVPGMLKTAVALGDVPAHVAELGAPHEEQFNKAAEAWSQGNYQEAAARGVATAIPFIGPAAAQTGEEWREGKTGQAAAHTVELLAPFAIGPAVSAIGKAAPKALTESATRNWVDVMKPTNARLVPQVEKAAANLSTKADRWSRVSTSARSLQEKAVKSAAQLGQEAKDAYVGKTLQSPDRVIKSIERIQQNRAKIGDSDIVAHEGLINYLDDVKDTVQEVIDTQPQQKWATLLDDYADKLRKGMVNARGEYMPPADNASLKSMQRQAATAIKQVLDTDFLDAKTKNIAFSSMKTLTDMLEATRRATITSRSAVSKGSVKGFGAAVERLIPIVRQASNVTQVMHSTPWNTFSAALKQSIAEAMAQGNWTAVGKLIERGMPPAASVVNDPPLPFNDPLDVRKHIQQEQ